MTKYLRNVLGGQYGQHVNGLSVIGADPSGHIGIDEHWIALTTINTSIIVATGHRRAQEATESWKAV